MGRLKIKNKKMKRKKRKTHSAPRKNSIHTIVSSLSKNRDSLSPSLPLYLHHPSHAIVLSLYWKPCSPVWWLFPLAQEATLSHRHTLSLWIFTFSFSCIPEESGLMLTMETSPNVAICECLLVNHWVSLCMGEGKTGHSDALWINGAWASINNYS